MKNCTYSKCEQVNPQPLENFCKDKKRSDGLNAWCRGCTNAYDKERNKKPERKAKAKESSRRYNSIPGNKEKSRERQRTWRLTPEGKLHMTNSNLMRRFGITLEQKRRMFDEQHGKCAICSYEFKNAPSACVDHNHKTGKVRKLLCDYCNKALGYLKENFETTLNMARYIQEDQGVV